MSPSGADGVGESNGSGGSSAAGPGASGGRTRNRGRTVLAAIVAAVLLGVGAFAAGWLAAPRVATPSDTSVEAGFARDMQTHHDQAVQMAMIIRTQTVDPEIRQLAYDIATSQAQQSGQMFAWLNLWGLPQASSQPEMTWMLQPVLDGSDGGHGHMGQPAPAASAPGDASTDGTSDGTSDGATTGTSGSSSTPSDMVPGQPMPGMATDADLTRLGELTGVDAERLFLQLMIAHHQGGVEMAQAAIARTTNPLVLSLAKSIVFAQQGEITYMQSLLDALPA